jgi:hypothetical protein
MVLGSYTNESSLPRYDRIVYDPLVLQFATSQLGYMKKRFNIFFNLTKNKVLFRHILKKAI